jgi:hypothetical protein
MDPITLILTALGAGAAAGGQAIAGDALKETYAGLKSLIQHKFAGKPKAELALAEHESDPEIWKAPLKKALAQEHVDQDQEVIEAAQKVMQIVEPQQVAMSKYNVQITGNVQGFAQGDHQTVTMSFGREPKEH